MSIPSSTQATDQHAPLIEVHGRLSMQLSEGVNGEDFKARRSALIAAGTDAGIANELALTACTHQAARDKALGQRGFPLLAN